LLRANFDVSVVGEAEDGQAAVRLLLAGEWDVACLSVRLPIGGGLHFLHKFKAERPGLPVVAVCSESYGVAVAMTLAAGACGYVMADALAQELVPSIRAALAGEVYLSAAMSAYLKP
jgi:DNA-binding NarL/FixJ family response regulator